MSAWPKSACHRAQCRRCLNSSIWTKGGVSLTRGDSVEGNPMKAIDGYFLIKPEDLQWRPSNLMKIPNADFLERTKSEILGARLWRLPLRSANTLHKHVRAEEFYF